MIAEFVVNPIQQRLPKEDRKRSQCSALKYIDHFKHGNMYKRSVTVYQRISYCLLPITSTTALLGTIIVHYFALQQFPIDPRNAQNRVNSIAGFPITGVKRLNRPIRSNRFYKKLARRAVLSAIMPAEPKCITQGGIR